MDRIGQLIHLRQGGLTMEEYVHQFCERSYQVPLYDESLFKDLFYFGLTSHIKARFNKNLCFLEECIMGVWGAFWTMLCWMLALPSLWVSQSPLRARSSQSPLRARSSQSPLRARSSQSPLRARSSQSPWILSSLALSERPRDPAPPECPLEVVEFTKNFHGRSSPPLSPDSSWLPEAPDLLWPPRELTTSILETIYICSLCLGFL